MPCVYCRDGVSDQPLSLSFYVSMRLRIKQRSNVTARHVTGLVVVTLHIISDNGVLWLGCLQVAVLNPSFLPSSFTSFDLSMFVAAT